MGKTSLPSTTAQKGRHLMSIRKNKAHVLVLIGIVLFNALLVTLLPGALAAARGASTPRTWHAVVAVESKHRAIQGMAFLPGELWINVGDTVVWNVKAGDIHTVTFLKPGQTLPPFNFNDPTQVLRQGS